MIKALTTFVSKKDQLKPLREAIAEALAPLAELETLYQEALDRTSDKMQARLSQAMIDNPCRETIAEYLALMSSRDSHISVWRILSNMLEGRRRSALVKVRPAFENLINAAVGLIEREIEMIRSETRATAERIGLEVALPSELINGLENRIARLRQLLGDKFNRDPLSALRHAETMLEIRLFPEKE